MKQRQITCWVCLKEIPEFTDYVSYPGTSHISCQRDYDECKT